MRWTPEQDAELLRLKIEGKSGSQVARAMGKTRSSVIKRMGRIGAPGVCHSKEKPRVKIKPRKFTIDRGDWDMKTFEPYWVFKARRVRERQSDHAS